MQLDALDWMVVVVCLFAAFAPAMWFAKRAGKGETEFFASGRAAPWWLIGTSMVATTFSTDTPNLVTDIVRKNGVAGNWAWWAFLLTGMLTVFFYARLWRRSGVLTDLEFYEIRYEGKPAAAVRAFRSVYLGIFFNCLIMAMVTLAATKIANVMLGWEPWKTLVICGTLSVLFSTISGLWGILVTDLIQFTIAMIGVVAATFVALDQPEVGGLSGLLEKIPPETLAIVPEPGSEVFLTLLVLPLAVQWWSVWYPGSEPGGGSYVAQRVLAAKDERHAMGATLWFNIAHYAVRPWPWIIVALCSILVFPEVEDIRRVAPNVDAELLGDDMAYPAMLTLLPHGLLGLLMASLVSAYISTMSTHLNWGASYIVHDLYRRFLVDADAKSEKHFVLVGRIVTVALTVLACLLVPALDTAKQAFDLLLSVGAGTGLLYLLRWYWWRINAWSEIAAMIASLAAAITIFILNEYDYEIPTGVGMVASVLFSTFAWLTTTFVTRPASQETLAKFYNLVRPAGPGWARVRDQASAAPSDDDPAASVLGFTCGCGLVYSLLFGTGYLIYGEYGAAGLCLGLAAAFGFGTRTALVRLLRTKPRSQPDG